MEIIDLSLELGPNQAEPEPIQIKRISHRDGADILGSFGGASHKDFPDEMGLNLEYVTLTTHSGTHIDAPFHYGPLSEGKPAKKISELPLDWFLRDGVVLNCAGDANMGVITQEEISKKLQEIGYILKPFDIVLIRTDADKLWGKEAYFKNFRGVSKEATMWLLSKGIKVIGIDTFGFDQPFHIMLDEYNKTKNPEALWPSHFYGREVEYCQIERLSGLSKIPKPFGFKVSAFPVKLANCGAAWSRVVAIFEKIERKDL